MTLVDVEARGLARWYGAGDRAVVALEPATFSIGKGARIALLGPSGSGKSTLLNLMAGLDEPSAGRISWPDLGPRETLRPITLGMIHQFVALIPTLTVAENVALPLRLAHCTKEAGAVQTAVAAVGLTEVADHLPDELSGGQAQRAGIARVLAHSPKLLLADEPTGQLDQNTGQAMLSVILEHADRNGTTLVIATHDPAVAGRTDHTWHMSYGRLIARNTTVAA